jgi:hypothetical protein
VPVQGSVVSPENSGKINIFLTSGARSSCITYPNNWIGLIRMEVFNVLGVSVYSTNPAANDGSIVLPSSLPEGLYVYRLSGSDGSQVGKFVLQ